jgi:mechanosensitive ion channel-like protein
MQVFFAAVDVSASLQRGLDNLIGFLPNLIGFLVIVAIGYIVARVVKALVTRVLEKIGTDRAIHSGPTGEYVNRVAPGFRPSSVIGAIAFWFLFLGALAIAVSELGITALERVVGEIAAYLPNVVAAVLILVVAIALAGFVGTVVERAMGETPTGKVVRSVAPVLILAIGTFMVLDQLQIAPQIVTITYAALLGGLALAMALAFGLGGRDPAERMLSEAYDRERDRRRGRFSRDSSIAGERTTAGTRYAGTAPTAGRPSDGPSAHGR